MPEFQRSPSFSLFRLRLLESLTHKNASRTQRDQLLPRFSHDGLPICHHVLGCQAWAPEIGSVERATYYRYMFFAGNTIEPVFSLTACGFEHPDPISAGWGDMPRVLATIEDMVPEEANWALGEHFTAADVVFGGLLDFSITFKWLEPSSKVAAYVERIRRRSAYQAAHSHFDAV